MASSNPRTKNYGLPVMRRSVPIYPIPAHSEVQQTRNCSDCSYATKMTVDHIQCSYHNEVHSNYDECGAFVLQPVPLL